MFVQKMNPQDVVGGPNSVWDVHVMQDFVMVNADTMEFFCLELFLKIKMKCLALYYDC